MTGLEPLIPITFFLVGGAFFISRSEIGKALAHRIRGGSQHEGETQAELGELRQDLAALRQELVETQERLDFAERMLSQHRSPEQLPRS
jgi:septal ring factor EnvC (AmiA/AmiB activator)